MYCCMNVWNMCVNRVYNLKPHPLICPLLNPFHNFYNRFLASFFLVFNLNCFVYTPDVWMFDVVITNCNALDGDC